MWKTFSYLGFTQVIQQPNLCSETEYEALLRTKEHVEYKNTSIVA